jgi:large subunit ribosomal protein L19e
MKLNGLRRRLASSILKCGKRKIWIDPNEMNELKLADNRKLNFIFKKNL